MLGFIFGLSILFYCPICLKTSSFENQLACSDSPSPGPQAQKQLIQAGAIRLCVRKDHLLVCKHCHVGKASDLTYIQGSTWVLFRDRDWTKVTIFFFFFFFVLAGTISSQLPCSNQWVPSSCSSSAILQSTQLQKEHLYTYGARVLTSMRQFKMVT